MAELLDDRYKLYEQLGEGGMAEVFRAEDLRLGREVAVKALRPQYAGEKSFLDRFINEARSMAGFSHPNVVNVYDVGRDGHRWYIVMEYVPGEDLRQILQNAGRLDVKHALDIARQMAQGIGYAHKKGLVHRDIKPGNILITPSNEVKVADFGIAKAMASVGLTEPGIVWGTTAYLSPEQVRGEIASPTSDVYAMGIVLYEMLAGHPPFQGEDRVAIALKHLHEEAPPLPEETEVPRAVHFLMRKALSKNGSERFSDANEMARALKEYLRTGVTATVSQRTFTPFPSHEASPPQTAEAQVPWASPLDPAASPNGDDARQALKELRRQRELKQQGQRGTPPQRAGASRPAAEAAQPQHRTDWVAAGLGILAVILVLGLIPLYLRVFELLLL